MLLCICAVIAGGNDMSAPMSVTTYDIIGGLVQKQSLTETYLSEHPHRIE